MAAATSSYWQTCLLCLGRSLHAMSPTAAMRGSRCDAGAATSATAANASAADVRDTGSPPYDPQRPTLAVGHDAGQSGGGPYPRNTSVIAANRHAAAPIVAACQISWKPNVSGNGFGHLVAKTSAPSEYSSPPAIIRTSSTVVSEWISDGIRKIAAHPNPR